MSRDFTKIRAWQLSDDLTVEVYKTTKNFPREEVYGLSSQLRRAASSVPANIAEGANRSSKKEYLQFLSVASGSLAEARYFLHSQDGSVMWVTVTIQKRASWPKKRAKP